MSFECIDQPGWSSEVEHNPKMSISFFWQERSGRGGSSSSTSPAWLIIRSECNPKMSISFFWQERGGRWALSPLSSQAYHQKLNIIQKWAFHFFGRRGVAEGVQVHQLAQPIIRSECNPKMSISFFWQERGGRWGLRWGLSPLTSLAYHQKLNKIQKWAFHFFGWRGVADGVRVHTPAWLIIRSST